MAEALKITLWAAVALAFLGAWHRVPERRLPRPRNRTAWVMLASVSLCLALDAAGVQFLFIVWMMFDALVVLAIIRRSMTTTDCAIIALFIPAWVFYLAPDPWRYYGAATVTIAQLLLTLPVSEAWKIIGRPSKPDDDGPNFDLLDLRAAHAGA